MTKIKVNRVILLASAVAFLLVLPTLNNLFSPSYRRINSESDFSDNGNKNAERMTYPQINSQADFARIKTKNIFMSSEEADRYQAEAADENKQGAVEDEKPVGENEVRDGVSGDVYKFLGVIRNGEKYKAVFWKKDEPASTGNKKSLTVCEGDILGSSILVLDIGLDSVKIKTGDREVELRIFSGVNIIKNADRG